MEEEVENHRFYDASGKPKSEFFSNMGMNPNNVSYVKDSTRNDDGTYTVTLVNMLPSGELIESVVPDYPGDVVGEEDEDGGLVNARGPVAGSVLGPEGYGDWNLEFFSSAGPMNQFYQSVKNAYGKRGLDMVNQNPPSSGLDVASKSSPITNKWTLEGGKWILNASNIGK